ncbi:MAG: signal peptidase II [Nanoarchaeota archaeon]|nr:signal peptidase II [Nanoarchaeota archaeon]
MVNSNKRIAIALVISSALILVDQLVKILVRKYSLDFVLIRNFLDLTFVKNTGAGFGILRGQFALLIFLNIIVIIFIVWLMIYTKKSLLADISLALIFGGAVGNLLDRVIFGFVTDFINFTFWPVFNIADSAVTVGVVMLAYCLMSDIRDPI